MAATLRSSLKYVPKHKDLSEKEIRKLKEFIAKSSRLFVMTGAGVSTESGIKDYRSQGVGLYHTSKRRPMQHSTFISSETARQRYWARNAVGWPMFRKFQPNTVHSYLATLENQGTLHWLATQNVDNLHYKAGSRRVTELHGTVYAVVCLNCHSVISRDAMQEKIRASNVGWTAKMLEEAPDADVVISEDAVKSFVTPSCDSCGGILKPNVVFFGGSVSKRTVDLINSKISEADALLVLGSSVETYSAYRHIKYANTLSIPIGIVNIGPTRVDSLANLKISGRCGYVFGKIISPGACGIDYTVPSR